MNELSIPRESTGNGDGTMGRRFRILVLDSSDQVKELAALGRSKAVEKAVRSCPLPQRPWRGVQPLARV